MIRKINASLKIPKQIIEVGVQLCPRKVACKRVYKTERVQRQVKRGCKWRCSRADPFRKLNVERHRGWAAKTEISLMFLWLYIARVIAQNNHSRCSRITSQYKSHVCVQRIFLDSASYRDYTLNSGKMKEKRHRVIQGKPAHRSAIAHAIP